MMGNEDNVVGMGMGKVLVLADSVTEEVPDEDEDNPDEDEDA